VVIARGLASLPGAKETTRSPACAAPARACSRPAGAPWTSRPGQCGVQSHWALPPRPWRNVGVR
jgi:hypothetical protein